MQSRLSTLIAALVAMTATYGCDDNLGPTPIRNIGVQLVVYSVNGTPPTYPVAIIVRSPQSVPIDANFAFDLAFDIDDDDGVVVVYTPRVLASELAATRRVGLQLTPQPFVDVKRAPTSGYVYDSLLVVTPGQTMLVDVFDPSCAGSFIGSNIRAKAVVDSFDIAARAIYLSIRSNPNCGLRSLVDSIPED